MNRCRLLVLLGISILLLFMMISCSDREAAVEIEAVGAVVLSNQGGTARVRSYSPEITLTVEQQEANSPIVIQVENIPTKLVDAMVINDENKEEMLITTEIISPTELKLQLVGGTGPQTIKIFWRGELLSEPLTFAVLGDSQGNNDVLAHIVESINDSPAAFVVHLGDMVPSGQEREYQDFLATMEQLEIPYFTVPGNHDVRNEGLERYQQYLAPAYHSFLLKDHKFIFLDTSLLGMDTAQQEWLGSQLNTDKNSLLFLHVPVLDPREKGHAFLDQVEAQSVMQLLEETPSPVRSVFSGHIHMFHHEKSNAIDFITSGGGGAHLYAAFDEGGFHHYTMVSLNDETIDVTPIPVEAPSRNLGIAVTGKQGDVVFTHEELLAMASMEREGQFQNVHGNFRGKGIYKGIPIRDLLEQIGGMEPSEMLVVHSWDGYSQEFAYENVFPQLIGWEEHQGEMVLAIEYNNMTAPDWDEGYRIVFLPEDGTYDNEDYRKTSMTDQGWYLYESAGSRWVKIVQRLEVIRP